MSDEQTREDSRGLAARLAAAQANVRPPARNKTAQLRGRNTYEYAGLDDVLAAVRPALSAEGIAFVQTLDHVEETVVLRTRLWCETGEEVTSIYPLKWTGSHHDRGTEITYARRYSLEAIVGVAASDDDDAVSAVEGANYGEAKQQQRPVGLARSMSGPPEPPPQDEGPDPHEEDPAPKVWHPTTDEEKQRAAIRFTEGLKGPGLDYDIACEVVAEVSTSGRRPSAMNNREQDHVMAYLVSPKGRAKYNQIEGEMQEMRHEMKILTRQERARLCAKAGVETTAPGKMTRQDMALVLAMLQAEEVAEHQEDQDAEVERIEAEGRSEPQHA